MAKIYHCTNEGSELRDETLQELSSMPESWAVLLNCRPAGRNMDREIDALVITQKALHIIEFKYRTAPVQIRTAGHWLAGKYEMKSNFGESPQEQVANTGKAFEQWLEQQVPNLKKYTLVWVVLEVHNRLNRIGSNAFSPGSYEALGHVTILSGVERLQEALQRRENSAKSLPSQSIAPEDRERLIKELGAKLSKTMTVQGKVIFLEQNESIPNIPVSICFAESTSNLLNFENRQRTDEDGRFEFVGVPLQDFRIEIENDDSWLVLPTGMQKAAGIVVAPIFLAKKGISEELIQELEEMMLQLKVNTEVGARKELDIEEAMQSQQLLLSNLINSYDKNEAAMAQIQKQLAELEAELKQTKQQLDERLTTDAGVRKELDIEEAMERQKLLLSKQLINSYDKKKATLAPIQKQLAELEAELKQTKQQLDERLTTDALIIHNTWKAAQGKIQKARDVLALRVEALKRSAIVGAAGGIIALQPLPFADNLILTPMQIGLVMWIGKLYKQDFTRDFAGKIIVSLGFGLLAQHATILAYKFIPFAWGLGAITVPTFTIFLGWMMSFYCENGYFPEKSEQDRLRKEVKTALNDKELLNKMKEVGSGLVQEIKARNYSVQPEDISAILDKLGEQGKEIGERLANLLGSKTT